MTSLAELLFFCLVGRIFIYLWMEFPLPQIVDSIKFIHDLKHCDLCSGVWGYTILAGIMKVDVLEMLGFQHIALIGWLITGGAVSFLVHLLVIGFREKFLTVTIS